MASDDRVSDEIQTRRVTYDRDALDVAAAAADPFDQFREWLEAALHTGDIVEPNAMTLATASFDGTPSARIVLLRAWDARGFVFFSNYDSKKGEDLATNPRAALLFWWGALERQIRIEGNVERISEIESDAYFATRPRGHRLSAWASRQSAVIADRELLERAMSEADARFPGDVPRPPFWGGYRVVPERFEFWQGRPNRVHDRIAYERRGDGWGRARLSP